MGIVSVGNPSLERGPAIRRGAARFRAGGHAVWLFDPPTGDGAATDGLSVTVIIRQLAKGGIMKNVGNRERCGI